MRAMTYRGPYKVRVENKPDPRIEHPNDAIVRVERAAICGSDLHLYHGIIPDTRVGHTFGHEFIGRVVEVGSSVENPADRPSFPKEQAQDLDAHWTFPDEQPEPEGGRERSIEHGRLTPVFGTAQPLHGVSGAIRRYAYARFSEAHAAHWLLLLGADRVEAAGAHLRSLGSRHPDDPITESGILAERRWAPLAGRRGRVDARHQWIDPLLVAGPWILGAAGVFVVARRLRHRR